MIEIYKHDLTAKTPKRGNLLKNIEKSSKKALTFRWSYDNIISLNIIEAAEHGVRLMAPIEVGAKPKAGNLSLTLYPYRGWHSGYPMSTGEGTRKASKW